MMRIRQGQELAMLERDDEFAEWYVNDYMREELPEHFNIREEDLKEMVLNGRRYAEKFALDDVESQAHFIMLMFVLGPNFFQFDGFSHILKNRERPAKERIEAIYEEVTSDQADHALANADSRYWYPELIDERGR